MEMSDILKKHFSDVEAKVGPISEEVKTAIARLDELEQKVARKGGGNFLDTPKSFGAQVAERVNEAKDYFENRSSKGSLSFDVKTTITSDSASGGGLYVPDRLQPVMTPRRRLTVRNLLPVVQVSTGVVQYPKLTTSTNNAATVAEGALKPESAMAFTLENVTIQTIAHFVPASRQILDDAPLLQGLIDSELLYGLAYVEDNQLLNGSGVGTDLTGLYTSATAFAAGSLVVASPTKIDVIGAAILQQNLTNLPADGIVVHPSDFTEMQLTKTTTGEYVMGDPQGAAEPRLFGLPVVATPAQAAGTFLVGNFSGSATLLDRWSPRVEISTEHADFFTRNMVAILCEERIGLATKFTTGFTKGTFSSALTDLAS